MRWGDPLRWLEGQSVWLSGSEGKIMKAPSISIQFGRKTI